MSNEKLLDRIQKLLALSTSSNAHEAALAMEKAMAMMAEHNLTNGDLLLSQVGEIFVRSTQSVSKCKDWETQLAHAVANGFGCKLYWQPGYSHNKPDYWGRFYFVGPKVNLPLVEYTMTYLLRKLVASRSEFSVKLSARGYARGKAMTAQLDGYCKGWLHVVTPKIHALALNIDLQEAINKFFEERITSDKYAETDDRGNGYLGSMQGVLDAKGVDINRPMTEQEVRRLA